MLFKNFTMVENVEEATLLVVEACKFIKRRM